jgi:hypothetical protein
MSQVVAEYASQLMALMAALLVEPHATAVFQRLHAPTLSAPPQAERVETTVNAARLKIKFFKFKLQVHGPQNEAPPAEWPAAGNFLK